MATNRTTTCPTCGKTISATIPADDLVCPNRPRYARGGFITGTGSLDTIPALLDNGYVIPNPTASLVVNVAILAAQSQVVTPAAYRQHVLGEWRS